MYEIFLLLTDISTIIGSETLKFIENFVLNSSVRTHVLARHNAF